MNDRAIFATASDEHLCPDIRTHCKAIFLGPADEEDPARLDKGLVSEDKIVTDDRGSCPARGVRLSLDKAIR